MTNMGYGQHQSFYIRTQWISKIIRAIHEDERFFYKKDAFEKIGLGKNMVKSLQYWVIATGLAVDKMNDDRKKVYELTDFANIIYKYDRFIRYNDSSTIMQYFIASEKEPASTWYWFFNEYNEKVTTEEQMLDSLINWINMNENRSVSSNSIKRDIDCLIKLYTVGKTKFDDPEEVKESPFHVLKLLSINDEFVIKEEPEIMELGLTGLYYTLLDYAKKNELTNLTVDEIEQSTGMIGRVFNLKRNKIIELLNQLTLHPQYPIKFTRTNRLDSIQLPNIDANDLLRFEYEKRKF